MFKIFLLGFVAVFCIQIQSITTFSCYQCNSINKDDCKATDSQDCKINSGTPDDNECVATALNLQGGDTNTTHYARACWTGGCDKVKQSLPTNLVKDLIYCKACTESNCNNQPFPDDV